MVASQMEIKSIRSKVEVKYFSRRLLQFQLQFHFHFHAVYGFSDNRRLRPQLLRQQRRRRRQRLRLLTPTPTQHAINVSCCCCFWLHVVTTAEKIITRAEIIARNSRSSGKNQIPKISSFFSTQTLLFCCFPFFKQIFNLYLVFSLLFSFSFCVRLNYRPHIACHCELIFKSVFHITYTQWCLFFCACNFSIFCAFYNGILINNFVGGMGTKKMVFGLQTGFGIDRMYLSNSYYVYARYGWPCLMFCQCFLANNLIYINE